MADKSNDPVAMWQNMLSEMGKGFSSFASQAMASPELNKTADPTSESMAGSQRQFGEMLEEYLLNMNLPSRSQMDGVAKQLQAIESQLSEIKSLLLMSHGRGPESEAASARGPSSRAKRRSNGDSGSD